MFPAANVYTHFSSDSDNICSGGSHGSAVGLYHHQTSRWCKEQNWQGQINDRLWRHIWCVTHAVACITECKLGWICSKADSFGCLISLTLTPLSCKASREQSEINAYLQPCLFGTKSAHMTKMRIFWRKKRHLCNRNEWSSSNAVL